MTGARQGGEMSKRTYALLYILVIVLMLLCTAHIEQSVWKYGLLFSATFYGYILGLRL